MDFAVLLQFFLDKRFGNLFILTAILSLAGIVIYYMYMHLSKKDLFHIPKPKDSDSKFRKFLLQTSFALKYIIIFPVYSFIWFIIFSFILVIISESKNFENSLYFGIVIVSAIRVSAYINEKMSEDIAKLLPLTMIATIIITPEFLSMNFESFLNTIIDSAQIITYIPSFAKFLIFTILLEWMLRILTALHNFIKERKKQKAISKEKKNIVAPEFKK